MAEKKCIKHPDRDAIALCYQCHKPVCNACMTVTEFGNFCSQVCSEQYKRSKLQFQKETPAPRKGKLVGKLIIFLVIIIAILVAIHLVAVYADVELLKKIDVLRGIVSLVRDVIRI